MTTQPQTWLIRPGSLAFNRRKWIFVGCLYPLNFLQQGLYGARLSWQQTS
jgi:hypothetical protein